ncbi:hypothetical protein R3P38DRAFT_2390421, partial [Favolaschia claudopus]
GFFSGSVCIKPDISCYSDKTPSNANLCRACDMELFVEVKISQDDPFSDKIGEALEKDTIQARNTRGQIITYLTAMMASQYCTQTFGVIIIKIKCRLLRLTRSGVDASRAFDY